MGRRYSGYRGSRWANYYRKDYNDHKAALSGRFGGIDEDVTQAFFQLSNADFERVSTPEQLTVVYDTALRLAERANTVSLPANVDARLVWLSDGDGLVARRLVAAAENEESLMMARAVAAELPEIQRMVMGADSSAHVFHAIDLPYGRITVVFQTFGSPSKRRWWSRVSNEEEQTSQDQKQLPALRSNAPTGNDIIGFALQQMLTPQDSQALILAAQQEALRLQVKQLEGQIDATSAQKELEQFLEQARTADHMNLDVEMDANFKRASGTTHISVKRRKKFLFFG